MSSTPLQQEGTMPEERLRERDSELVRIVEALDVIIASTEWHTLKDLVFDKELVSIASKIMRETSKPELSLPELYRLQGEKKWSARFSSLELLRNKYHTELVGIRKRLTLGDEAP